MKAIHQQPHSGTRKQFIGWTAGFLLSCQILLGNNLLNIDFGVGMASQKQGPAAIGNSPTDFWNHYNRDQGSRNVFDLVWSDGSESMVDLTVDNAPGAWGNGSLDPMFGVYLYPSYGENITVTLNDLPAGIYALYLYAHGALDNENGVVGVASGGITYGPLSVGTAPGWISPIWENERQYVLFDAVVVGADHQVVITVFPGDSGLAVLNGLQLIKTSLPDSARLINVDFSGHQNASVRKKSGPAVLGYSPEDAWNLYSRDDGSGGFLESGELSNLVSAEGSQTGAGLTVQNAPGLWIANHSDAMLDSYLYPHSAGEMVVTVTNLTDGRYDLYFYAHGYLDGENGNVQVRVGDMDYGVKVGTVATDWQTLPWQEGVQYLRFQDLSVSTHLPMVITIRPGTTGLPVMNGMQLFRHSECSPPADLVAWWPGEGDGKDVAGGNDGELVNGLGFGEGLVGQAFEFNADGQYLLTPTTDNLEVGSLTMEAWINPSSIHIDMPVVEYAPTPPHLGVGVHLWISVHPEGYQSLPGSLFANVISADGVNHIISTAGGVVQAGVWSHIALNYDMTSGLSRLFHNGTQVAEEQLGSFLPRTALPVLLGHRTAVNAGNFNGFTFAGQMDEVSIYSRALSVAEIETIYTAGSHGKCQPVSPCAPPPPGLLAWWPGEGDGKDVAGGNDGELVNGVGWGDGVVGQALVFDGIDDHVRIPFSDSLTSETFSAEAWIKPLGPVIDPQWNQDFVFGQALGSPWLVVRPGTSGVRPVFGLFVDPFLYPEVESIVELPLDKFSHVAGTWDGTGLRIYVNGVLAGETFPSQAPVLSTCDFYIGGHLGNCAGYDFDGGYFHGSVDELSLYGRALSDSEIAAIHAAGSDGKCLPQGFSLTVGATPGGTVQRDPDSPNYQPADTVTLTALPDVGFVFDHWQGAVSGTDPEVTLVMDGPKQVMAVFLDVAPPAIAIHSPAPGTTALSTFILSGSVTDNLGVGSATWELNGEPLGFLPLNGGEFYVDGLQWALGENRIRVVAVDNAGNEASTEIVVEWVPVRLLSVVDPFPRQEGQRIHVTIQLSSSGDVGGASFVLRYNPAYLKQPGLDWSPSVQSALNQVNTDIPGEVRATFALPATAVPAGTRNLAVVTFRARSVPETLTTPLQLQLLDVSDPNGNSMAAGSAVRSGQATILMRRVVGDNNANHRLDVGDATLIQRLLTGIDPVRFWDRSGNDVNENALLDSGDVIRVLRAVVGLDSQPLPSGGVSANIGLARANVAPMSEETAGAIVLEADSLRAAPGELVTVRVRLAEVLSPIAAVALNIEYPVEALRLLNLQSHRVGEAVPATAVAIWNVAPAQNDYTLQSGAVSLAVSSALSWPSSDGVVAEFTFQVQEGQTGWHRWPIRVGQAEISADGYDMAALTDSTVYFVGRDPVPPQLTPALAGLGEDGFGFSFQGEIGVEYSVEVSSNLIEWVSLGTRTGANEPITISDPAALGADYRFYRVRFE